MLKRYILIIMRIFITISFLFLTSCGSSDGRKEFSGRDEIVKDSLLLSAFVTQDSERALLDSLFKVYWQRLSDKEYENTDLKIRPDFGLALPQLLDECAEVTNELIEKYEELSDYDTLYNRILIQLDKEGLYVDDSVLKVIHSNLEQWESRNLGIPNTKLFLHLYYAQLRVQMLEVLRKQDLDNIGVETLLLNAQKEYEMVYDSAYYFD